MAQPTETCELSIRVVDLRRHLFALSSVVHDVLEKQPLGELQTARITPDQFRMLRVLHHNPELRVGEVALALGIKTSSASLALDRLEAKGLLERRADPRDRRVTRLLLTERGSQVFEEAERISCAKLAKSLPGIDDEALERFTALCGRFVRGLLHDEEATPVHCFHCGLHDTEPCALAEESRFCPHRRSA